jgi:hypothetical protein
MQCAKYSSSPLLLLDHVYLPVSFAADTHEQIISTRPHCWVAPCPQSHGRELSHPGPNKKHNFLTKSSRLLGYQPSRTIVALLQQRQQALDSLSTTLRLRLRSATTSKVHSGYVILHHQLDIVGFHMSSESLSCKRFPQFDKSLAVWERRYGETGAHVCSHLKLL